MSEMIEKVMDGVNEAVLETKMCAKRAEASLKHRAKQALTNQQGAVDIVVILLLIVVVIALVVIFRTQLEEIVTGVFNKLKEALNL